MDNSSTHDLPTPVDKDGTQLDHKYEKRELTRRSSSRLVRYLWDEKSHGPNISFVDEQLDVVQRGVAKQSTDGARGTVGFNSGRHTFKFTFSENPWGSHCAIGVCSKQTRLSARGYQHLFGTDAMSWAWDIPSGTLLHNGETKQIFTTQKINSKVIYMTLDMNRGVLYFQPKDMDRFQAFAGLKDGGKSLLYPCVSLVYARSEVRISLKHSSYPEDKPKRKLSKRSSTKSEESHKNKDKKDERNLKKRDTKSEPKVKEDTHEEKVPVKKASRVSFQADDNDDSASERSQVIQVSSGKVEELSETSSRDSFSHRETVTTGYDEKSDLAPVDQPVVYRNPREEFHRNRNKQAEYTSPRTSPLPVEPVVSSTNERIDETDIQSDTSKVLGDEDEREESTSATAEDNADEDVEEEEEEEDDNGEKASEESEKETSQEQDGYADERASLNSDSYTFNSELKTNENLYLSRKLTSDHEMYTLKRDGTLHKEYISEKQRTESLSPPSEECESDTVANADQEARIPSPVTYCPLRSRLYSKPESPKPLIEESQEESAKEAEQKEENIPAPHTYSPAHTTSHSESESRSRAETERRYVPEDTKEAMKKYLTSSTSTSAEEQCRVTEEPADARYTRLDSLNESDRYSLILAHGWDLLQKGGAIQLYPNIPYICIPIPTFSGRVQAVRAKRAFSTGIHRWRIRELPFFSPAKQRASDDDESGGIQIGVASNNFRRFNQGFRVQEISRHAWCWDSLTGTVYQSGEQLQDSQHSGNPVDLHKGVELTLNLYKRTLTFTAGSKTLAEISDVRGSELYPFVLFNRSGFYPVAIEYLEGPEEYIEKTLLDLQTKDGTYREKARNYKGLSREISSKISMVCVETGMASANFDWGSMSTGLKCGWGRSLGLSKHGDRGNVHYVAFADKALHGGRHKIEFTSQSLHNFVFGLVSENFDQESRCSQDAIPNDPRTGCTCLGTCQDSWAWDLQSRSIYHAGTFIGKYPRASKDLDNIASLRMILDFGHNGYNLASFRAVNEDGSVLELGIAFVSLPEYVIPAVALRPHSDAEKAKLSMEYIAGPKEFVTEMNSRACTIL